MPSPNYYQVDIVRKPALSMDAEQEMFRKYRKRRTAAARKVIVEQYLYWAAELACRYCGPRVQKQDAISAANHGLMLAIEKFDPERGIKFIVFSYSIIRRQVLYAVRDACVINPEPGIRAARYRFNKSPQTEQDRKQFDLQREEIYESVETPVSTSGCPDDGVVSPHEELSEPTGLESIEQASLQQALAEALPRLPAPMQEIVKLRYFPETGAGMSWAEIGAKLNLNASAARMRMERAIKLLRRIMQPVQREL